MGAKTNSRIYIHCVFSVKNRKKLIHNNWESSLHKKIGYLINEAGAQSIIVNGMAEHLHCFFNISPKICISEIMKSAKAKSSLWVNKNNLSKEKFMWQVGFSAYSVSLSDFDKIYNYVKNQKYHHRE